MPVLLFVFLIWCGLLWAGGTGLVDWFKQKDHRSLTYSEFVRSPPGRAWVKVGGAGWKYEDAIAVSGLASNRLYIPVHPAGSQDGSPTILVRIDDDDVATDLAQLFKKDAKEQARIIDRNGEKYTELHEADGLIEDMKNKDEMAFRRIAPLAKDFRVIKQDGKPDGPVGPIVMLLIALGVPVGFFLLGQLGKAEPSSGTSAAHDADEKLRDA